MLSQDDGGQGRLRVVVLQDGLPGHPRRLPGRPAGGDQADPGDRDEHVHLAEHGRPVDRQPVLPLGPDRLARSRRSRTALRARRDAVVTALERELPEARFARPEGGYFMWVELPEEVDVAELEKAAKERDVVFVKGTDFLLEGGRNTLRLAYSGVTPEQIDEGITRLADAVALARGRRLGAGCASSATTTGAAARSSASCTARRWRRPVPGRRRDPRRLLARPLRRAS